MNNDFEDLEMDMESSTDDTSVSEPVESKRQIKSKTPNKSSGSNIGKRKNLFFRSTIGPERSEKLAVGDKTPIADIKETIGNMFGLAPEDFHLSHAGRTLNEDAAPNDYGIDNGDELLLIPHSTAGSEDVNDITFDEIENNDESSTVTLVKSKTPIQVDKEVSSKTPEKQVVGKKLNIYFKSTIGAEKTEKLSVGDKTEFSDIKDTLSNLFGLTSDDFNLSHAGRVLNDVSTPEDYGIENNDEVLLIPYSTAGSDDEFEDLDLDEIDSGAQSTVQIKSKTPSQSKNPASGNGAGETKNIYFRSTVGPERSEKLSVGEKAPIRDIKETLGNLFSLEADDFHLSHAGRTMNEDATPSDYGIENGDEVLLIPHSTAGNH